MVILSTRQLQTAIDDIDEELYDNLVEMLPPLRGDSYDPTEIDNRNNLVEILQSFAPSDYFAKRNNMKKCLDNLPPAVLRKFVNGIKELDFIVEKGSHMEMTTQISSIRWSNRRFSDFFLDFFNYQTISALQMSRKLRPTSILNLYLIQTLPSC